MRRTHKQIVEQKAQYVAARIEQNAKEGAESKAKKNGGVAEDYLAECISIITTQQLSSIEKAFDRDFGAKTRKATSVKEYKLTEKEMMLREKHAELELHEIYQMGLDKNTLY